MRLITLVTAFSFLFAVPRGFSPVYELFIVTLLCLLTLYLSIRYYANNQGELCMLSFVIAVFYNPYFLIKFNLDRSPLLDTAAAFIFFVIALSWNSIVKSSPNNHV